MSENGKIVLTADDGSKEAFFVVEKVKIAGISYLLVAESEEDDADALILREIAGDDMETYEVVDDEQELKIISNYMEALLEEVEIRME